MTKSHLSVWGAIMRGARTLQHVLRRASVSPSDMSSIIRSAGRTERGRPKKCPTLRAHRTSYFFPLCISFCTLVHSAYFAVLHMESIPSLQLRPSAEVAAQHRARGGHHALPPVRAPRHGQAAQEAGERLHQEARHLGISGCAGGPGEWRYLAC